MKIMVCYPEKKGAEAILTFTKKLAVDLNAHVDFVVSLIVSGRDLDVLKKEAEETMNQAKSAMKSCGVDCATHILEHGLSEEEALIDFANNNKVDIIIVGTRQRSRLGKLIMGSIAQEIILRSRCPVISVPLNI